MSGRFKPAKPDPVRFAHREAYSPNPFRGVPKAKFRSKCSACGGMIEVDDPIVKGADGKFKHHPKLPTCMRPGKSRPIDTSNQPVISYNPAEVDCPDCGAPAGHACRDERGRPVPYAEARILAAREACNLRVAATGRPRPLPPVTEIDCPYCNAPAGQKCVRSDGTPRERTHRSRRAAATT